MRSGGLHKRVALSGERDSVVRGVRTRILLCRILFLSLVLIAGGVAAVSAYGPATPVQSGTLQGDIAVRQAYLSWLAAEQEAGMNATISFIAANNGSTDGLSSLAKEFHGTAQSIPVQDSRESLDSVLCSLREVTREFQDETRVEITAGSLDEGDLAAAVSAAADGDTRSRSLEDEYWMTRMDSEPAAFDRYIRESQETLSVLQGYGYDVTPAQERLDQIATMRSEYAAALGSHDFGTAEIIREKIQAASVGFEGCVKTIRETELP